MAFVRIELKYFHHLNPCHATWRCHSVVKLSRSQEKSFLDDGDITTSQFSQAQDGATELPLRSVAILQGSCRRLTCDLAALPLHSLRFYTALKTNVVSQRSVMFYMMPRRCHCNVMALLRMYCTHLGVLQFLECRESAAIVWQGF